MVTPKQEQKRFAASVMRYRKSLMSLQSASRKSALALAAVVESIDAQAEAEGIDIRLYPKADALMLRLGQVITDMAEFFEEVPEA